MNFITLSHNLNRIEAYLTKQEVVLSAQIPEWFKKMTRDEQKEYLKEHPRSKLKPGGARQVKKIPGEKSGGKIVDKPPTKKPTSNKSNPKDLSDKARKIAEKYAISVKKLIKESEEEGDKESVSMFRNDIKDLNRFADLIKHNKYRAALNLWDNLDTDVRDEIPDSILKEIGYKDYDALD